MKIKSIVMFSLAAIATSLTAMPTKQDLKQVEGLVQELMRPELDAFKSGKKTRADVAKSAISLAEKAESDAAKMLLLKGSFTFYVGHGAFDEAIGVLKTLKTTIPDIPPEYMANMIESALRNVPKNKGGLIYRLLDDTKSYVRHQDELKNALAKSSKHPSDKTLHLKIAELYVSLGDWDKALDEFAKGDNPKAAEAAKAEKGEGKMPKSAIAEFWWSYPANGEEELQKKFKRHAAAIYAEAITSGYANGLVKVKAQRCIDEVKGYGDDMLVGIVGTMVDAFGQRLEKWTFPADFKPPLERTLKLAEGVDMTFCACPPGSFRMARKYGVRWAHPTFHRVNITRPFWMSKMFLTTAQYGVFRHDEQMADAVRKLGQAFPNDPVLPILKFKDAAELMTEFNKKYGAVLPEGYVFRLATEAETKYALNHSGSAKSSMCFADIKTKNLNPADFQVFKVFDSSKSKSGRWGIFELFFSPIWRHTADSADSKEILIKGPVRNSDPIEIGDKVLGFRENTVVGLSAPDTARGLVRIVIAPDLIAEKKTAEKK